MGRLGAFKFDLLQKEKEELPTHIITYMCICYWIAFRNLPVTKAWKGRIISALRKLTFSYPPRNAAKKAQKVAPASYRCESCEVVVYEGTKDLENAGLEEFNDVIKGKLYMDHISPVIPLLGFSKGDWSWDEYIERMFCEQSGYQVLCESCHDLKTQQEDEIRKKARKSKK